MARAAMTHRQRIMARIDRQPVDREPWFPDLSYWHQVRTVQGTVPAKYRGLDLPGLHRHPDIDAGLPRHVYGDFLKVSHRRAEIIKRDEGPDTVVTEYRTPAGTLTARARRGAAWESPFRVEYPVKTVEDFKVVEFLLRDRVVEPDFEAARKLLGWVGEQGTCQMVLPRSPLPRIIHDYMGLTAGIFALLDSPDECQGLMAAVEESEQPAFEIVGRCPGRLTIFGDNVDSMSVSPDLYRRYSLPYYQRKCEFLHARGKTVLCHMDGRLRGLLPLVRDTGIDILDGITPEPMNDYGIAELAAALGERQLAWAGVPASMFCAAATRDEVRDYARRLMDTLGDRLILNVGDQLPPNADISLVEAVSDLVNRG
ncbi:MAG: uroporphyrinogen decarboxylase family protein [Planctomycetota bacterium]